MEHFVNDFFQDFTSHLAFSPTQGHISFDKKRVALVHSSMYGKLTGLLVDSLGIDRAGAVLTEIGYNEGAKYKKLHPLASGHLSVNDELTASLNLHSIAGMSSVESKKLTIDQVSDYFYAELLLKDSFEAESYLAFHGTSEKPVCWIQTGHLSALITNILGKQIIFKEVECCAMGHKTCRVIGKKASEWGAMPDILNSTALISKAFKKNIHSEKPRSKTLIGESPAFCNALNLLKKVAPINVPVLLTGETGVGKELFAQELHKLSSRCDSPFIAINCGAISSQLLEAELFGVEKGAYTGAHESRSGRFERANRGSLFLDEIATLDIKSQAKLLRVLQEGELERLGDTRVRKVDVRIIAATNLDLWEEVKAGRFREDLYFRLGGFPITIPSLRERGDDLSLLIDHFLPAISSAFGKKVSGITGHGMAALKKYRFPGNIRELIHYLERGIILADEGGQIDIEHLFPNNSLAPQESFLLEEIHQSNEQILTGSDIDLVERLILNSQSLEKIEDLAIQIALKKTGGNASQAAKIVGLTRPQLLYRLNKKKTGSFPKFDSKG